MYLVLAIESMSGPTWPPSCPAVRMEAASSTSASSPSSDGPCSSPPSTRISTEAAMHLWPQQPAKDATMSLAAILKSQSCRAIRWFFAPPRAKTLEYHKRKTIKTTTIRLSIVKWNEMKWKPVCEARCIGSQQSQRLWMIPRRKPQQYPGGHK